MLDPRLIDLVFKAASMERWNDFARIIKLSELDKQAHKFIIAFFIAKKEGFCMQSVIEAGIFEMLARVIITDIRPDVYHKLNENCSNTLNDWALTQLDPLLKDLDDGKFLQKMHNYFSFPDPKLKNILKAASYLATLWEFQIIEQSNSFLSDIDELKAKMQADMDKNFCKSLNIKALKKTELSKLIDLSGRLRFQKRWSSTPRIPATTVLGHMLIVALLSYFYSLKIKACKSRLEANFYCALFHDLPESLTRDIISPVKYGAKIDAVLNEYEIELITLKFLPCVPEDLKEYFAYILGLRKAGKKLVKNEFENRVLLDGETKACEDLSLKNEERFHACDGRALKACDNLAALLEAGISIHFGIKTKELENALLEIYKKLEGFEPFAKLSFELVSFYQLEAYFKKEDESVSKV